MSDKPIRLAVVGTGYVGLTTGACFAHLGHHVVCGDIDARKVDMLNDGHIPIVEEGLESIVNAARAAGRLEFVLGAETAVGLRQEMLRMAALMEQLAAYGRARLALEQPLGDAYGPNGSPSAPTRRSRLQEA